MAQIKSPVQPVIIDYVCDVCEEGKYRPTGICFNSYPPQYPHRCDNETCNDEKVFNLKYPSISYEPIKS